MSAPAILVAKIVWMTTSGMCGLHLLFWASGQTPAVDPELVARSAFGPAAFASDLNKRYSIWNQSC